MKRLLVNPPTGGQELLTVDDTGGYFDPARVLWDEGADGPLPAITLGGMKRVGNALQFDATIKASYDAIVNAAAAEAARQAARDAAVDGDGLNAGRAFTLAQFDAWWLANADTDAKRQNILKRLVLRELRRA